MVSLLRAVLPPRFVRFGNDLAVFLGPGAAEELDQALFGLAVQAVDRQHQRFSTRFLDLLSQPFEGFLVLLGKRQKVKRAGRRGGSEVAQPAPDGDPRAR